MSEENTFKFNSFLFFLVLTFYLFLDQNFHFSAHSKNNYKVTGGLLCVKRLEMFVFIFVRQTDCEYFKRQ